jgi:hypothetical protein
MTVLSLPIFSFPTCVRRAEPTVDDSASFNDVERRKVVADMIAAGACDSEYGMQMLMSIYPSQF